MPRPSNRIYRQLDPLAAEAARALALRRDAVLPNDHAIERVAAIRRSDVDLAVELFRAAVAGTGLERLSRLLDGPAGEAEPVV